MNRQSREDFLGSETTQYDAIKVDTCHIFVKTLESTPNVNSNVNYRL